MPLLCDASHRSNRIFILSQPKTYQHRGSKSLERKKKLGVDTEKVSFKENDKEVQENFCIGTHICKLDKERDIRKVYTIDNLIGRGNFSDVYLVVRKLDCKKFAMKKIDKECLNGAHYLVDNEVEILRNSLHKNICRLLDAYETRSSYFLIFEYLQNGDLFETLKTLGKLSEKHAAKIVAQVASALDYLHDRKIVHRDVKPENLLLTSEFLVKLTDFGLACFAQAPLYRVCGTPNYIAPEILKQTGYGVAVDIWSLGIILHVMLVGYQPFRCTSRRRLFRMIQDADFSFTEPQWDNISKAAISLLNKMLEVEASNRLSAAQVRSHRWITSGEKVL